MGFTLIVGFVLGRGPRCFALTASRPWYTGGLASALTLPIAASSGTAVDAAHHTRRTHERAVVQGCGT